MQRFLDLRFPRILLQVHHLLKVNFFAVFILGLLRLLLLLVADRRLALISGKPVLLAHRKQRKGMRPNLLVDMRVIGAHPAQFVVVGRLGFEVVVGGSGESGASALLVFAETLGFAGKPHVVSVQLLLFVSGAEVVGSCWVVGRLRGYASERQVRVPVLCLVNFLDSAFLHALCGGEDAVPVAGVPDFEVGVAEEALLAVDFFQQFFGLGFSFLSVLVELLFILFELDAGRHTRMMKLLMRRLQRSTRAGRMLLRQLESQCRLFLALRYSCSSCWLCFLCTNELYIKCYYKLISLPRNGCHFLALAFNRTRSSVALATYYYDSFCLKLPNGLAIGQWSYGGPIVIDAYDSIIP